MDDRKLDIEQSSQFLGSIFRPAPMDRCAAMYRICPCILAKKNICLSTSPKFPRKSNFLFREQTSNAVMILVIRASDGASFSLDASHFNAITTLAEFRYNLLSPLLAIAPECLICMNEEGAQLREEALPQLIEAAAQPEVTEEETRSRSSLARNKSTTGAIVPEDVSALSEYKRIYVFDREHLDADPEVVANALIITEDQVLSEPELGRKFTALLTSSVTRSE